jgi:hypothetical protein
MSTTESVTLDGISSTDVALAVLYAAAQGKTVSELALTRSLSDMVRGGIDVVAAKLSADTSKIPAVLLTELESQTWITSAIVRMRENGADLNAIVSAISE